MDKEILDIGLTSLLLCYAVAGMITVLYVKMKLDLGKELVIALTRMTLQLLAASLLLKHLFAINNLWLILLIFVCMSGFASHIILKRSKVQVQGLYPKLLLVITSVSLLLTLFFLVTVAGASPWYDARYFIPLAGMILGNSMNACALALDRFFTEMKKNSREVETLLVLGATPKEVSMRYIKQSMRNAALPFITNMSGIGIVFIPGLMTGQLLSGTDPLISVKYQIAIMIAIATSVSLTSLFTLLLSYGMMFNRHYQLVTK
jgi:putative ABC transport system permease protein